METLEYVFLCVALIAGITIVIEALWLILTDDFLHISITKWSKILFKKIFRNKKDE